MKRRLIVFYDQSFNAIAKKGEIVYGYFNSGEIFDDIIVVNSIEEDIPLASIQELFGKADFQIRYYGGGLPLLKKTFLWNSYLLKKHAAKVAEDIFKDSTGYDLTVRIYGFNIFCNVGYHVAKILKAPCYISLHSTPDFFPQKGLKRILVKARYYLLLSKILQPLRNCSATLLVYENLLPYCKKHKINNTIILRNIVNSNIDKKSEGSNDGIFRIVNIGRQIEGKNPVSIIEAMSEMKNAEMTIVGDGYLHETCCQLAEALGVSQKIKFIKSVPNNEIGMLLKQFDVFVAQTSYPEYPKTIIEAQRSGLPVIINNSSHIAPEAQKSCLVVNDNKEGFKKGLELLQQDGTARTLYAEKGYAFVRDNYNPENIIQQYKKILNV